MRQESARSGGIAGTPGAISRDADQYWGALSDRVHILVPTSLMNSSRLRERLPMKIDLPPDMFGC